jgi:hypothetical protein
MMSGLRSGSGSLGPWKVGEWRVHDKSLVMCESGFHASVRAVDAMRYVNCEVLALVEVRGKHLKQDDKQVWESMRVVKAYEWTKPDSVAMSIYAAELVIGIFEKKYPDDKRPRESIEAAKAWLKNPTEENRKAADAAASYAADAAYADASADASAASADAAYAAYAAAYAASAASAAYAASASYAAYADAAAAAAYAAAAAAAYAARKDIKAKCHEFVMDRLRGKKQIGEEIP